MSRTDDAFATAREIGAHHGRNAASWVFDGNTARETYEAFQRGIDEGDPEIMDQIPSADLSGQWSHGYTVGHLMDDCGMTDPPDSDEVSEALAEAYEEAFADAACNEVERMIAAQLNDEHPADCAFCTAGEPMIHTYEPPTR